MVGGPQTRWYFATTRVRKEFRSAVNGIDFVMHNSSDTQSPDHKVTDTAGCTTQTEMRVDLSNDVEG